jgi:hypothetical protein
VGNTRISVLKTLEWETLRKIYGPIEDQNSWRIRANDELQVMYRKPNIVTTIKVRRLEWAGHLVRMSDDRTVKKVFLGKPDGRIKTGRPKLRWLDCIENYLTSMDVKRWRKKAEDRSVCAIVVNRPWLNCKERVSKKKNEACN